VCRMQLAPHQARRVHIVTPPVALKAGDLPEQVLQHRPQVLERNGRCEAFCQLGRGGGADLSVE
jgi:hypothetical protein